MTNKKRIEELEKDVSDLRQMVFDLAQKLHEQNKEPTYFG